LEANSAWIFVIGLATVQLFVACFAVYSSNQNILSTGACIGGIFGTLANLAILLIAIIWAFIVLVRSFKSSAWHPNLAPISFVICAGVIAIAIGQYAALRCTV
jgi:uncharacterized membrane-anchored protein